MWGGRHPSARLRELGGNIHSVADSHRDLLDEFEALDPDTQRAAARWLARRAFGIADLDQLDGVRPALDALDDGLPLPAPFTNPETVCAVPRPDDTATTTRYEFVRMLAHGDRPPCRWPIDRPSFAVPAIFAATHPDPPQALVDTFHHTKTTFDDRSEEILAGLRERYLSP
jgi:hypothetical protein